MASTNNSNINFEWMLNFRQRKLDRDLIDITAETEVLMQKMVEACDLDEAKNDYLRCFPKHSQ